MRLRPLRIECDDCGKDTVIHAGSTWRHRLYADARVVVLGFSQDGLEVIVEQLDRRKSEPFHEAAFEFAKRYRKADA